MAKVYQPDFGKARGKFGKVILFQTWKGILYARKCPTPSEKATPRRQFVWKAFAEAVKAYRLLTTEERMFWRAKAYGKDMSGYEYFLRHYLENFPGYSTLD
jgi:hypothetical protein